MDEVKKQEPINLELFFLDKQDIEELTSQDTFRNFIKRETSKAVLKAIGAGLEEVKVFNLYNLGLMVTIHQSQYKKCLTNLLSYFEKEEEYGICKELTDIISKL